MMGPKPKKPTCLRCSMCNLNYKPEREDPTCVVCDGSLDKMYQTPPHDDLLDRIQKAVYQHSRPVSYGGATALEKFDKDIESLAGVDDFLFECGEAAA